jgi:hypothetical protein
MVLGSGIWKKKPIPDPGSRGQKGTGSRIRNRNTKINQGILTAFWIRTFLSNLVTDPKKANPSLYPEEPNEEKKGL